MYFFYFQVRYSFKVSLLFPFYSEVGIMERLVENTRIQIYRKLFYHHKWNFSDNKFWYDFIFLLKTLIVGILKTLIVSIR